MSTPPHHIVVLDGMPANPGDVSWAPLESLGQLTVHGATAAEQTLDRVKDATAIVTNKVPVRAEHLDAAPNCRIVCSLATGFDHIDIEAARARGIRVTNVPAYSTQTTAQLTIGLLLALAHRVEMHDQHARTGWPKADHFSYWLTPQHELAGRRMLIVGGGAIGQQVASIAQALGMHTSFAAIPGRPERADRTPWLQGLAEADVVSLHVPLNDLTRHLIDTEALNTMKASAWLLNGARGAVVDEDAVAEALHNKRIAAYATDVLSVEPPPADHVLFSAPNCLITPHLGWVTVAARERLIAQTARSIAALDAGEAANVVA